MFEQKRLTFIHSYYWFQKLAIIPTYRSSWITKLYRSITVFYFNGLCLFSRGNRKMSYVSINLILNFYCTDYATHNNSTFINCTDWSLYYAYLFRRFVRHLYKFKLCGVYFLKFYELFIIFLKSGWRWLSKPKRPTYFVHF